MSLLRNRNDQIFLRNTVLNFTLTTAGLLRRFLCILSVKLNFVFFILNMESFCLLEVLNYSAFGNDVPKEIFFVTCFIYFFKGSFSKNKKDISKA